MAASHRPSTLDVCNAVQPLTVEQVRQLVFQMGVPFNILEDIEKQFVGEKRKQHFVQRWLDMFPDASWKKLVAGLRKIKMNSLATEIESAPPLRSEVSSSDSVSLISPSATSAPSETSTPAPAGPLTPPDNSSSSSSLVTVPFEKRVEQAETEIEHLEEEFSDIKSDAQESLSEREKRDEKFLHKFKNHLFDLPCTKKQVHVRFFTRNEKEILESDTIQKLFIILGRHCNYTNYEVILHIVKRFCKELTPRMLNYRDSLIVFEKATTVDVYLCAISARSGGMIYDGFLDMTMKINKPASECTLYEIRELKESIEEKAELKSYAVYIGTPEPGSVCVGLCIPEEVGWMVGVVLTPDFRHKYLLSEVTVTNFREKWSLAQYLVRKYFFNDTLINNQMHRFLENEDDQLPNLSIVIIALNTEHFLLSTELETPLTASFIVVSVGIIIWGFG